MLGVAAGAAGVYFALERPALDAAHERIEQNDQDLAALRGRLDESLNALAVLEGRFLVEESTRRGLETSLRTAQAELGRAQDTIAFYEQLMPPGPSGAVSIRALDVERSGPHLNYRLLLMRSGASDKPFQGVLKFRAAGRVDGKETTVELQAITVPGTDSSANEADPLGLEFTEFQRSSGVLGLPPGFDPKSVTVDVLEGRTLRVSRSIELPGAQ